jgi:hypothetical protein
MALVSKSKAAKLAGVSRTTIHRYASDGKLSMTGDQIDTAELLRVFGSITEQPSTPVQDTPTGQAETGGGQGVIDLLEAHIKDLRQDRDHWRDQTAQLAEMLKAEQETAKLLTHSPKPSKALPAALSIALGIILGFAIIAGLVYLVVRP